jgi:cell division protein FtsN
MLPPWVIALLILIPLIVLLLLYFFIWKDKDNKKEFPTKQIEVVDTVATQKVIDSAAIKKAEEERLIKEQEEKEATQKAKIRKHHIIVGSFKNEANAKKRLNKLKSKGFENATSFSNNSLIMVSATSFESLIEAREAQEKFLQEYRMENWIMTRK